MKELFLGILVLLGIWWLGSKAYQKYYIDAEKKPFWVGTDLVQVCKTPYYSSSDCYKLNVTLLDDKTAQIEFPNGGYKVTEDLTCYFAGLLTQDQPRYVFCRSWDSEGEHWDYLPVWVNY